MTCGRCGATNTPGAKLCPACGNSLPPEPFAGSLPVKPQAGAAEAGSRGSVGLPGFNVVSDHLPGSASAAPPRSTNGLAIAAMVLGIVWVYWVGSILALIFGYIAKGQINASAGRQGGKGMAIAGIVLGWVGIGTFLLCIVALMVGASNIKP
jgi:hypothetical protein